MTVEQLVADRSTELNGRIIGWTESGLPDGIPVVRMPGTPGSRWLIRADALWAECGLRVITVERPGFGISSRLPDRGFNEHADDVAVLLDYLHLQQVHVMAVSGGAPHLLALAARHPARVARASVIAGAAPHVDAEIEQMVELNRQAARLAEADDLVGLAALLEPIRGAMLADPLTAFRAVMKTAPAEDLRIMRDHAWQQMIARGLREALSRDLGGWLDESYALARRWGDINPASVKVSLTWWHGESDRNAPLSAAQRLVHRLPDARLMTWGDEGHLAWYRREGQIIDELLDRAHGVS